MADKKRKVVWVVLVLLAILALVGFGAWWNLLREVPQQLADDSMEEYFKYGSIGAENAQGIPYWIFLVLPKMFPEYLPRPGGYAALGFFSEQGRDLPVGFSKKTIGFERVGINCALCHAAVIRKEGEPTSRLLLGGPGNTQDILGWQRFMFQVASDPRFNAGNVMNAIGQVVTLPLHERLLYRFVLIPQTKQALLKTKEQFTWTDERPPWGRGRIDPFNPVKISLLKVPIGDTIGNSDMEPIWNLRPTVEAGRAFHWDGLNTDVTEVVLSSALGDGATPKSLPLEKLGDLEEWLLDLPAPEFEDFYPIDPALAAAGEPVFRAHCAECHGPDGERTGQPLPLDDPAWRTAAGDGRTDPHRAQMWTQEAADAYNAVAAGEPWAFSHFRSTGGYVSVPLDAIWVRAPYLHNGSVPYLAELFEMPANRTPVFYRGYDLYDPERMGYVSEGPEAERFGWKVDTSETGNSNQGHLWGVELSAEEKRALVEYLKTL